MNKMKVSKEKVKLQSTGDMEEFWKVECDCGRTYRVKKNVVGVRCPGCDEFINIMRYLEEVKGEVHNQPL